MKKKNQEALRTALNEFQDAYRVFLDDERKMGSPAKFRV